MNGTGSLQRPHLHFWMKGWFLSLLAPYWLIPKSLFQFRFMLPRAVVRCRRIPLFTFYYLPLFFLSAAGKSGLNFSANPWVSHRKCGCVCVCECVSVLQNTNAEVMNWTKKERGLKYMPDFTLLSETVTVAYQLNDGTTCWCNEPLRRPQIQLEGSHLVSAFIVRRRGPRQRCVGVGEGRKEKEIMAKGFNGLGSS